jgi:hypothetical protein
MAGEVIFPALATVDAGRLNWGTFLVLSHYNYSTLLGGPLTEEPGWRGFALPRLQERFHPVVASVMLGAIWATWHLPFFQYPGWNDCPFWIYVCILTGSSVLLTWATNFARYGVIAAIAIHAANNSSGVYFRGLFAQAEPGSGGFLKRLAEWLLPQDGRAGSISISFYGLIAIGLWLAALVAIAVTRGRLGRVEVREAGGSGDAGAGK